MANLKKVEFIETVVSPDFGSYKEGSVVTIKKKAADFFIGKGYAVPVEREEPANRQTTQRKVEKRPVK